MRNLHYIQIQKGNTEQAEIFTKLKGSTTF